ncbi:MAG: tetratricopeptide repeat protein, partial [bacterium]|nr:tetratricopeptide repeat protein [bacterium]
LTITGTRPPGLERAFRATQYRLSRMLELRRNEIKEAVGTRNPDADPQLEAARAQAESGDPEGALRTLAKAEATYPTDPRIPFRKGKLFAESSRPADAILAFRRALLLDPEVALNYYHLGLAHKERGDTVQATFFLEQAARRFEGRGNLPKLAQRAVRRLIFPVVGKAGISDGAQTPAADTPAGRSRQLFDRRDDRVVWWAWIEDDYVGRREEITVRWYDPSGSIVQDEPAAGIRRPHASAELELTPDRAALRGIWRVEARLDDDLIDRRTFRIVPEDNAAER